MKNVTTHFGPASLDFHLNRPVISSMQRHIVPPPPAGIVAPIASPPSGQCQNRHWLGSTRESSHGRTTRKHNASDTPIGGRRSKNCKIIDLHRQRRTLKRLRETSSERVTICTAQFMWRVGLLVMALLTSTRSFYVQLGQQPMISTHLSTQCRIFVLDRRTRIRTNFVQFTFHLKFKKNQNHFCVVLNSAVIY